MTTTSSFQKYPDYYNSIEEIPYYIIYVVFSIKLAINFSLNRFNYSLKYLEFSSSNI